jgi:hypothetical protein
MGVGSHPEPEQDRARSPEPVPGRPTAKLNRGGGGQTDSLSGHGTRVTRRNDRHRAVSTTEKEDDTRQARTRSTAGYDEAVVEWQNAAVCSRHHLRPDGYGVYRHGSRYEGFFLEYDRGTMNARDYFKKFGAYYRYGVTRRFERDYTSYPTILVVTSDNAAEERIARVARAAAVGQPGKLPLLLTCQWRINDPSNRIGLLGRIWREPQSTGCDRCSWPVERTVE